MYFCCVHNKLLGLGVSGKVCFIILFPQYQATYTPAGVKLIFVLCLLLFSWNTRT